jgi:hypothetical protein
MHYDREKQQIEEREREQQKTPHGGRSSGAAQAQAGPREGREAAHMAPVEKNKTCEFVDDENLGRQSRHRGPLPFGHDGLARAEDAEGCILTRRKFAEEAPALGGAGVIFYAIDVAAKTHGRGRVAGEQIEFHGFAVDLVEQRNERVERAARSALDQEHAREGRDVAAEEIAQGFILRDHRILRDRDTL